MKLSEPWQWLRLRILLLAGLYSLGGSSTVIENLASQLAKYGHDVTIGALIFRSFPVKGVYEVVSIPVGNIIKLCRFLSTFDIIHSHHAITNYLALLSRKPFIYHYHGAPDFKKGYLFRMSMLPSIKITNRCLDAAIAVSAVASAELKQLIGLEKIHVISNGVDTSIFKLGLEEKFRKGRPQFLFVGNLYEHKNVAELIFATKKLVDEYPETRLQIVGNGDMSKDLKQLVVELCLEKHVDLVGRVSLLELPYYYASCDVYVTASRWEMFGLPLLEAMACGKPVVASAIPAHLELITKSKAGKTYPNGDLVALSTYMTETYEERGKYRNNAFHFAKKHDWSETTKKVLQIYTQVHPN